MSAGNVCGNLSAFLKLIGFVVTIVKIVIPLLLVVFGMLDVGKSVVASKPDEVTKSLKSFAMRCVAAVLVFFVPSIVAVVLDAVAETGTGKDGLTGNPNDAKGWRCCWSYVLGESGNEYCNN